MRWKEIVPFIKETFADWGEDKAARLAAALAYYTVFSLAPLLVIVIGIAGLVFGQEAARGQIAGQLNQLIGAQAANAVQAMLASSSQKPSHGILATVLGVVTLLLGAGGVFGQLQDALNTIWGVAPKPGRGFWAMVKDRFLSFTMVLGVGFLLLVSLALSAGLTGLGNYMGGRLTGLIVLWHILNIVLSFGVTTLLFAMIFKVLPDAKVQWRDVWIGALLTAFLFTLGKFLIGLYLGRSGVTSAFGAAGSLILVLLWVYYSAQILFFGAEFTKVYAKKTGSRIVPAEDAVAITPEARAEQGIAREEQAEKSSSSGPQTLQPAQPQRVAFASDARSSTPVGVENDRSGNRTATTYATAPQWSPVEKQSRALHIARMVGYVAGMVGVGVGLVSGLARTKALKQGR